MQRLLIITSICAAFAMGTFAQDYPVRRDDRQVERQTEYPDVIPAGVRIQVRTSQTIDVHDHSDGRVYPATVAEDVFASDGRILIPRGAQVELIAQNVGDHEMSIDLESLVANGKRYMVGANIYRESRRAGVGGNKRTGEYVGGGAIFGTILGAIAGGGKGAAIGALVGGATGAGAQTFTRGRDLNIPAESLLTFRLEQPLEIGKGPYTDDNGYDDHGFHYHNGYYDRGGHQ